MIAISSAVPLLHQASAELRSGTGSEFSNAELFRPLKSEFDIQLRGNESA